MQLSPSKLSVLRDCQRCFWLANNEKINRPRGIFPSLPGGIDRKLKVYYDSSRPQLPKEIEHLEGQKLFGDVEKLNKWRNWRSGLTCVVEGVKLIGALDDALINENKEISPLDYKTKGSEPKDNGSQYYQTQLDCYDLMLRMNGYKTTGYAYLVYYWPEKAGASGLLPGMQLFRFGVKCFQLNSSEKSAVEIIIKAKKILEGKIPEASENCEYCKYENQKKELCKQQF